MERPTGREEERKTFGVGSYVCVGLSEIQIKLGVSLKIEQSVNFKNK